MISAKRAAAVLLSLLLLLSMLVACDTGGDESDSSLASSGETSTVSQGPLDHIETQDLSLVLNVLVEGD